MVLRTSKTTMFVVLRYFPAREIVPTGQPPTSHQAHCAGRRFRLLICCRAEVFMTRALRRTGSRFRQAVIAKEHDMTTHDESTRTPGPETRQVSEPAAVAWAPGAGHAYPATAPGVPLSAFAFAFAVGFLGLVESGILSSAANDIFIATCFGIGSVGLLIGGLWEYRSGELFGGTFGVGYAGFLFSTALILKFFAGPIIAAGGPLAFDHAFAAWLILWALFTAVFAIGASSISLAAFAPFTLAFVVLVLLAIANLGGAASWTTDVSKIGGWVAIADGFAAGYLGAAIVLNVTLGRELLPMWPAKSRPKTP
jgi:hypothetical protein